MLESSVGIDRRRYVLWHPALARVCRMHVGSARPFRLRVAAAAAVAWRRVDVCLRALACSVPPATVFVSPVVCLSPLLCLSVCPVPRRCAVPSVVSPRGVLCLSCWCAAVIVCPVCCSLLPCAVCSLCPLPVRSPTASHSASHSAQWTTHSVGTSAHTTVAPEIAQQALAGTLTHTATQRRSKHEGIGTGAAWPGTAGDAAC